MPDRQLARDILQDVYLNIWSKIDTYDSEKGRLFTWMARIARNSSLDMLKNKYYRNIRKTVSISPVLPLEQYGVVHGLNIETIGLQKAIGRLHPRQQKIINLVYFKGYSLTEIERMEKMPLGTVKTRLRSALGQLRYIFV